MNADFEYQIRLARRLKKLDSLPEDSAQHEAFTAELEHNYGETIAELRAEVASQYQRQPRA